MIDLKSFADECRVEIVRDAPIENMGLLFDTRAAVLAPFYDAHYLAELEGNPSISMVLTTPLLAAMVPRDRGVATSADPVESFYMLHCRLEAAGHYWADFASAIASDARIHPTAYVADRNVRIGAGTIIGPMVVVEEHSIIGEDCVIGAGTVIGTDGVEVHVVGGRLINVPHGGGVRIGAHVTIQSNVVVDRALFGSFTEIGDDTVVDNLVHIAHAVSIGRRCHIVAGVFIGGSTIIGDDVWLGPNATISSALHVGDRARVSLGAVVTRDVPPGGHVSGNFAVDHQRLLAHIRRIR